MEKMETENEISSEESKLSLIDQIKAKETNSEESKLSLIDQIKANRDQTGEKDVIQERQTKTVPLRNEASDSQEVLGSGEDEGLEEGEQREEGKNFQFTLGDESFDIDENAELEFKADGKVMKMSLKEMRDSAAGGVAVRNRMRQLAEEKKKINRHYENFNKIAEKDPLSALKKVFSAINEVDPEVNMDKFLVNLGKQAQNLTQMSPSEKKAYSLEQELDETKKSLSETERLQLVQEKKQELIGEYGLTEEQILSYGQQLLSSSILADGIENEEDLFDRIGEFADEVHRQQAVIAAVHKYDPKISNTDPLVFELSSLLEKNPDFDESDLEDIAEGVLFGVKKSKASTVLSKRQRSKAVRGFQSSRQTDLSKMSSKDALKAMILEKRNDKQR